MHDRSSILVYMNRLDNKERAQIIRALVEGNSIRSTVRMTGFAKNTITKLLVDLGRACAAYQDRVVVNITSDRIECDEIWAYCHSKARNVPEEHRGKFGYGDIWTWVAIDPDTKLVVTWLVGMRELPDAMNFIGDLKSRLAARVQTRRTATSRTSRPSSGSSGRTWTTRCCSRNTASMTTRLPARPPAATPRTR